jgi:hypothetical protein
MIGQTLVAHLWNGGAIMVEGNPTSIDMLRERLVDDREVKAILIYQHPIEHSEMVGPALKKISQANYTQLKEERENRAARKH